MLLYYIRHGDPVYYPDSLTHLGERQAEAVGRRLALHGLDAVYASTSKRAIQTAVPVCEMLHLEPILLDWCNESRSWEVLSVPFPDGKRDWVMNQEEIVRQMHSPDVTALGQRWYTHPCFAPYNAQFERGIGDIRNNVHTFIAEQGYEFDCASGTYLCRRPNDRRIAIFAHGYFGMLFLSSLLNLPFPEVLTRFDFSHSGVTVYRFRDRGGWTVPVTVQLSSDSHLYSENLPLRYNNGKYL